LWSPWLPNASSASLDGPLPLDAYSQGPRILADDADLGPSDEGLAVVYSVVGEDYFETVGTASVPKLGRLKYRIQSAA